MALYMYKLPYNKNEFTKNDIICFIYGSTLSNSLEPCGYNYLFISTFEKEAKEGEYYFDYYYFPETVVTGRTYVIRGRSKYLRKDKESESIYAYEERDKIAAGLLTTALAHANLMTTCYDEDGICKNWVQDTHYDKFMFNDLNGRIPLERYIPLIKDNSVRALPPLSHIENKTRGAFEFEDWKKDLIEKLYSERIFKYLPRAYSEDVEFKHGRSSEEEWFLCNISEHERISGNLKKPIQAKARKWQDEKYFVIDAPDLLVVDSISGNLFTDWLGKNNGSGNHPISKNVRCSIGEEIFAKLLYSGLVSLYVIGNRGIGNYDNFRTIKENKKTGEFKFGYVEYLEKLISYVDKGEIEPEYIYKWGKELFECKEKFDPNEFFERAIKGEEKDVVYFNFK